MSRKSVKKSNAGWYIAFALLAITGITVIGATHEMSTAREWVTIKLPNPPAPLAYVTPAPVVPAVQ
jgi:hypothetical protein